jgi:hypothetical protein
MPPKRPLPLPKLTPEEEMIRQRNAPKIGDETVPHCGRCDQPRPLSTWGKYARVYCDPCAAAVALERLSSSKSKV